MGAASCRGHHRRRRVEGVARGRRQALPERRRQRRGLGAAAWRDHARERRDLPVHLLAEAVEADGERRRRRRQPEGGARRRVHQVHGVRDEVAREQRAHGGAGVLEPFEAHGHQPLLVGHRPQLHGGLHDHAERAVGADEELGQVVACDVLHDLAAAVHDGAVGGHHGDADEQVARGAVQMTAWPRRVGGEHAAERRARRVGRIEREPLAAGAQGRLQRGDGDAGLRGRREVAGLVLDERAEPREQEHQPGARRRHADADGAAAAPRHDGHARLRRLRDDGRDLVHAAGPHRRLGRAALDHVRRQLDAGEDVGGADDGAELVEQRHDAPGARSAAPGPESRWRGDGTPRAPSRRTTFAWGTPCRDCRDHGD